MALRAVGKRNPALNAAAVKVALRLADSPEPTARWIGKDALREYHEPLGNAPPRVASTLRRGMNDTLPDPQEQSARPSQSRQSVGVLPLTQCRLSNSGNGIVSQRRPIGMAWMFLLNAGLLVASLSLVFLGSMVFRSALLTSLRY